MSVNSSLAREYARLVEHVDSMIRVDLDKTYAPPRLEWIQGIRARTTAALTSPSFGDHLDTAAHCLNHELVDFLLRELQSLNGLLTETRPDSHSTVIQTVRNVGMDLCIAISPFCSAECVYAMLNFDILMNLGVE